MKQNASSPTRPLDVGTGARRVGRTRVVGRGYGKQEANECKSEYPDTHAQTRRASMFEV